MRNRIAQPDHTQQAYRLSEFEHLRLIAWIATVKVTNAAVAHVRRLPHNL